MDASDLIRCTSIDDRILTNSNFYMNVREQENGIGAALAYHISSSLLIPLFKHVHFKGFVCEEAAFTIKLT